MWKTAWSKGMATDLWLFETNVKGASIQELCAIGGKTGGKI
jgi:hypothetical protein